MGSVRRYCTGPGIEVRTAGYGGREEQGVAYYLSQPILIKDYDPSWPAQYEQEKTRIRERLGDLILSIEHVGSTSIPGCGAKPIIDMSATVNDLNGYHESKSPFIERILAQTRG